MQNLRGQLERRSLISKKLMQTKAERKNGKLIELKL